MCVLRLLRELLQFPHVPPHGHYRLIRRPHPLGLFRMGTGRAPHHWLHRREVPHATGRRRGQGSSRRRSLADVSTWADEIRRQRESTAPLHYANPAPGSDGFNLDRDCPEEGCVVSAIIKYSHVLRDKNASRQENIEPLKFVVHFVGDVHQPLHLGRARDRGGNDISRPNLRPARLQPDGLRVQPLRADWPPHIHPPRGVDLHQRGQD